MTTDELHCVDACTVARRMSLAYAPAELAVQGAVSVRSDVLMTCASVCDLTAQTLACDADFGAREIASLCSKLCRNAADHVLKGEPVDATKELVDALIACADACHVVALGTHPATS